MSKEIERMCHNGIAVGLGIGLIPLAAVSTIVCSKIILMGVILRAAVRIFNLDELTVYVPREFVSLVQLPRAWKAVRFCAKLGAGITALAVIVLLINCKYSCSKNSKNPSKPDLQN